MASRRAPKGADPVDWWIRLTELPRPSSAPVALVARGREIAQIRYWSLTPNEIASVRVRSDKEARTLLRRADGGPSIDEERQQQTAAQLVALVAREAEDIESPVFARAADVRGCLTDEEIAAALLGYLDFQRDAGPVLAELMPREMEAWIKFLMGGANQCPLDAVQWGSADRLSAVPGVDGAHPLDCHFLAWIAARRVLYPD